jgi:uncharacterized protein
VLFMTVGLPATGKSTFARRLAPLIGAAILESDALRHFLFPEPAYTPGENQVVFRTLHEAASTLLERGVSLIVDATSIVERDRRPLYSIAEKTGARLLIARFEAPLAVVAERLERRRLALDPLDRSRADMGVYERMAARSSSPSREHWTIDTSDPIAANAAMAEIVAFCCTGYQDGAGRRRFHEQAATYTAA